MVERHSGPPWEKPGVRALELLAMVWGGSQLWRLQAPFPPVTDCSRVI